MKEKSRVLRWVIYILAPLILAPLVLYVYEMRYSSGPDLGYDGVLKELILREDGSYEIHVEVIRRGMSEGDSLFLGPPRILHYGSKEKPKNRWKRNAQLSSPAIGPDLPTRATLVYLTDPLPPDPGPFYLRFELNISASAGGMQGFLGQKWTCLNDIEVECMPPVKD